MSVSTVWGPGEVDASALRAHAQRERFTRGLAEVLMVKAYDAVTVADVCLHVGGSRRTFYEYFDDKVGCLLTAYDDAAGAALTKARASFDAAPDWAAGIRDGLATLLDAMAHEPELTRLCVMDVLACGHLGRQRHTATLDAIAEIIDRGRAEIPDDLVLPHLLGRAAAGAGFSLIYDWVCTDRIAELPSLAPQLTSIVLVPYIGRTAAARYAPLPLRLAG
ncbi:MAG: TetR/AcrR family transcriptional regulator [Baekduia sp.]